MVEALAGDPLGLEPRVAGLPRRGWGHVAASLVPIAVGVYCVVRMVQPHSPSIAWAWLACAAFVVGPILMAIGIDELRRPIRVDRLGVAHDDAIRGAPLRWHPRVGNVPDEYERTTQLQGAGGFGDLDGMLVEALLPRVHMRITFERPPLRVGTVASIRASLLPSRGRVRDPRLRARLRCVRENPGEVRWLASRRECLADLAPRRVTRRPAPADAKGAAFTLEFALPPGLPGSDLLARRPVYWELKLDVTGLRAPYGERFFVPVAGQPVTPSARPVRRP